MFVVAAEEGITGYLSLKLDGKNSVKTYREMDQLNLGQTVGGYDGIEMSKDEALDLDSQGRCVMIELKCQIVVICVYCPANSGLSEEGELFRMKFLKVLFKRIRNLYAMGKNPILMGDVNVCRDLIDSAESLEVLRIPVTNNTDGIQLEKNYCLNCQEFVMNPATPHRRLLNQLLKDSIVPDLAKDGILVDSTRWLQTRKRVKMYTVWNTLKNYRPVNYGSRVDFILTSDKLIPSFKESDILADVMGSDHCPVYLDLDLKGIDLEENKETVKINKIPRFEARFKYDLMNHDVLKMFAYRTKLKDTEIKSTASCSNQITKSVSGTNSNAKRSRSIDTFFSSSKQKKAKLQSFAENATKSKSSAFLPISQSPQAAIKGANKPTNSIKALFGKAPLCKHGEDAILKTSRTSTHPGKRFWVCNRPQGDTGNTESSCGFFQWV